MSNTSGQVKVQASMMTDAERMELAKLRAENEQLRALAAAGQGTVSLKLSEKAAISIFGLQAKFPITLYERVLDIIMSDDFRKKYEAFKAVNRAALDASEKRYQNMKVARRLGNSAV